MKLDFSSALNERQAEAVQSSEGPLLIVAGAGSGKTRVITWRIAYLIGKGVPQSAILAVTFTNKAAREMAQRVRELVPRKLTRLTVCTFHAFGAQVLRERHQLLGYRANFSIYDSQDQASLLRETSRDMGAKGTSPDLAAAAQAISAVKTGRSEWNQENNHIRPLFREYQRNLRMYNAVDFDDLIILPFQLLNSHPEVRSEYHQRFRYILVDEFQDTSAAQYELLRLLVGPPGNVCVVGDDDQSIYSWRGASYENILRFESDFPGVKVITLEQNYRSTGTILRAANALIAGNARRKKKALWTGLPDGEPIEEHAAETEVDEAEFIASRIRTLMLRDSYRFEDFGVLVRANHLTRALEEAFRKESIPYFVSGGMSFFERQEVRDMLAYLKLVANPDHDTSLLRIVNTPRRGIGRKLLEKAALHAGEHHCSLFSAIAALGRQGHGLEEKSMAAAAEFTGLVEDFRTRFLSARRLSQSLRELVEEIDYWGHLVSENKDARDKDIVRWKLGNVDSLIGSLADFEEDPDTVDPTLFDYLRRVSLASRDDLDARGEGGRVNLMTIHAAKGLEFPVVFVAAVEKDIIPHVRSMEETDANVEEERRLFYVALTRARKRLFLSFCSSRRRMGKPLQAFPSPFLDELPPDCVSAPSEEKDFVPDFQKAWKKIARD
ncbi:MAG: UvrD-helicase domain-containing protein [Spirochaetia bacterium]|jgi:DNA helicase-2/ATP-dependent DNA helicase PcrA